MISSTNSTQCIIPEERAMEGISHPSIGDGKTCRRKSDFDQQQTRSRLSDVELNSTLTSAGRVCW